MKPYIKISLFLLLSFALLCFGAAAQWKLQKSNVTERLRSVGAVNSSIAWAGGNKGACIRTTDGGATWSALNVPDSSALDFRDLHAVDADAAYLLSIGAGDLSRIYKTTDGGKSWAMQFKNENPKAFFDAIAFWDSKTGIAFSDPVDGKFLIITTADGGATWKEVPPENIPPALSGESAFAASGTCIAVQGKNNVWIGTGGAAARVFRSTDRGRTWKASATPIISGSDSSGIFSLAFKDSKNGVAVGGDYKKPDQVDANAAVTNDGGITWKLLENSKPSGYRSCVAYVPGKRSALIAVGPSGSDYSNDDGSTWKNLGKEGFHSVAFAGTASGWAVGEDGKTAKFEFSRREHGNHREK